MRGLSTVLAAVGLVIGPGATITAEFAFIALDFDEEEAAWGDEESVNFVYGAVVGDEGEVGPAEIGVAVGEAGAQEF